MHQHMGEIAEKYGEQLHFDADDLTIDQIGNGTGSWAVLLKGDRRVVYGVDDSDRFITLGTLDALRKRNRDKVIDETVRAQNNR